MAQRSSDPTWLSVPTVWGGYSGTPAQPSAPRPASVEGKLEVSIRTSRCTALLSSLSSGGGMRDEDSGMRLRGQSPRRLLTMVQEGWLTQAG